MTEVADAMTQIHADIDRLWAAISCGRSGTRVCLCRGRPRRSSGDRCRAFPAACDLGPGRPCVRPHRGASPLGAQRPVWRTPHVQVNNEWTVPGRPLVCGWLVCVT